MLNSWQPENMSNLVEGHGAYLTASLILNTFQELVVSPTRPGVRQKYCDAEDNIRGSLVRIILSNMAKENGRPWSAPRTEKGWETPC